MWLVFLQYVCGMEKDEISQIALNFLIDNFQGLWENGSHSGMKTSFLAKAQFM
jgi:hypothetical protein